MNFEQKAHPFANTQAGRGGPCLESPLFDLLLGHDRMKSSFPTEGFGQIHGSTLIEGIDRLEDYVKSFTIEKDFPGERSRGTAAGNCGPEVLRRIDGKNAPLSPLQHTEGTYPAVASKFPDNREISREERQGTPSPLDMPVRSLKDKWRLLPHFLKLRGLMKQHIDSFDYFVNVEMKQIVQVRVVFILI